MGVGVRVRAGRVHVSLELFSGEGIQKARFAALVPIKG